MRAVDRAQGLRVGEVNRVGDGGIVRRGGIGDDLRGRRVDVIDGVERIRRREACRIAGRQFDRRAGRHVVHIQHRVAHAHVVHARRTCGDHDARVGRLTVDRLVDGEHLARRVVGHHLDGVCGTFRLERPPLALVQVDFAEMLVDDRVIVVLRVGNAARHERGGVAVFLKKRN